MKKTSTVVILSAASLALVSWSCGSSPAAPQVAASPSPTATPAPSATPAALGCRLARMPDHGNCRPDSPSLFGHVDRAIDILVQTQPQLFDLNDNAGFPRCPRLLDGPGFQKAMVRELEKMGLCAQCDEECGVKSTNDWEVLS